MNIHRTLWLLTILLAAPATAGEDISIPWHATGAGGEMFSSGFELSNTVGQWDASETRLLSGSQWRLTGSFWGLTLEEWADL